MKEREPELPTGAQAVKIVEEYLVAAKAPGFRLHQTVDVLKRESGSFLAILGIPKPPFIASIQRFWKNSDTKAYAWGAAAAILLASAVTASNSKKD
jgi:hypothetical protein